MSVCSGIAYEVLSKASLTDKPVQTKHPTQQNGTEKMMGLVEEVAIVVVAGDPAMVAEVMADAMAEVNMVAMRAMMEKAVTVEVVAAEEVITMAKMGWVELGEIFAQNSVKREK